MPERKSVNDSTELLHRISQLSHEAAWTTDELREALKEGGVDPDRLVSRVMADVKLLLDSAPEAQATNSLPLLGILRQRTQLAPSAIANAMQVPVTFLSAVSRYPQAVPLGWQQELARRAERQLQVEQRVVIDSLLQPFEYELAASRATPYSDDTVQSYEDILDRSGMSDEACAYWRDLATDASV